VQADSSSDSESRHKECPLFNSAGAYSGGRLWQVGLESQNQTVYRNDFLIPVNHLTLTDSVAFSENYEDLRFMHYGTHNENHDDGEVESQHVISTRHPMVRESGME